MDNRLVEIIEESKKLKGHEIGHLIEKLADIVEEKAKEEAAAEERKKKIRFNTMPGSGKLLDARTCGTICKQLSFLELLMKLGEHNGLLAREILNGMAPEVVQATVADCVTLFVDKYSDISQLKFMEIDKEDAQ